MFHRGRNSKQRNLLAELSGKIKKRRASEEDDGESEHQDEKRSTGRPVPPKRNRPYSARIKKKEGRPGLVRGHRKSLSSPDVLNRDFSHRHRAQQKILPSESVPGIVKACVAYLEKHGARSEGIFRINGDLKMCQTLLDIFAENSTVDLEAQLMRYHIPPSESSSRTVASLLKMYFRSREEPLLPYEIYNFVLRYKTKPDKLKEVILDRKKVSKEAYDSLAIIMQLCRDISKHSDENKMTPNALSICWSPSLLRAPPPKDDFYRDAMLYSAAMDAGKRNKVIETLISNFDDIFPLPANSSAPIPPRRPRAPRRYPQTDESASSRTKARARKPPPKKPTSSRPEERPTKTKKKVIYGVPMFGGGSRLHAIETVSRVATSASEEKNSAGIDDEESCRALVTPLSDDSSSDAESNCSDDDEESNMSAMLLPSPPPTPFVESDKEEEEGGGSRSSPRNVTIRTASKMTDDYHDTEEEEEEEEEDTDTPEPPATPQMRRSVDVSSSSDDDEEEEEEEPSPQQRQTPRKKEHASMRVSPLRRALVKGESVPRPPTPLEDHQWRDMLIHRPKRRARAPEIRRTDSEIRVLRTHEQCDVAQFFDILDPTPPSERTATPRVLRLSVAKPYDTPSSSGKDFDITDDDVNANDDSLRAGSPRMKSIEDLMDLSEMEEHMEQSRCSPVKRTFSSKRSRGESLDDIDNESVRRLSDSDLSGGSFFVSKDDDRKMNVLLMSRIEQLQQQLNASQEIVRRLEQQMAVLHNAAAAGDQRQRRDRGHVAGYGDRAIVDGRKHLMRQTSFAIPTTTVTTSTTRFVYAQGEVMRLSGWSLFSSWKRSFLRIDDDELLVWDSREDALGGRRSSHRYSLLGARVNVCVPERRSGKGKTLDDEGSRRRSAVGGGCLQIAVADGRSVTLKGITRRGGAYWFTRLKDKISELSFDRDVRRRLRAFQRQTSRNEHPDLRQKARAQFAAEGNLLQFLSSPSAFSSRARPPIRVLDLSILSSGGGGMSDSAMQVLRDSLSNHFYLEDLRLRGSVRGARQLDMLSEAIKTNTSLRRLDLSSNSECFTRGVVSSTFVEALKSNRNLRALILESNGITHAQLARLRTAFRSLEEISLASNCIDDLCCGIFVDALVVRFEDDDEEEAKKADNTGGDAWRRMLRKSRRRTLRRLNLASNKIGTSGVKELATLGEMGLEILDLSKNHVDDEGVVVLCDALKSPTVALRSLYLENNPITSTGSRALTALIRKNRSISNLSFADYDLDASSIQALRVMSDFGSGI